MKLVRRLALLILAGIGGVFFVHTVLVVQSEIERSRDEVARDGRLMGRALALTLSTASQEQSELEVLEDLVEAFAVQRPSIPVRWIPAQSAARGDAAALPPGLEDALRRGLQVVHLKDAEGLEVIHTYTPLLADGKLLGAIEVSESIGVKSFLYRRIGRQLLTALAMVGVCGLLSWAVGRQIVGRPTRALVEAARRIGSGDFSTRIRSGREDELGEIAAAMTSMAEELAASTRRLSAESEARRATLEQLRHANRLATVGKLSSVVAHETGTLLHVMAGRARMIASGEGTDSAAVKKHARVIVEQAERISEVTSRLLQLSRGVKPERRLEELDVVVAGAVEPLRSLAQQGGVEIDAEAADPIRVEMDRIQIQQALTNLVMNAVQASPAGSTVTIRQARASCSRPMDPAATELDCVRIEVRDRGTGISPEALTEIFTPFFTTRPPGEGTGLGLSVSRGIVEEHGGWIEVDSVLGKGSRFTIVLPLGESDG